MCTNSANCTLTVGDGAEVTCTDSANCAITCLGQCTVACHMDSSCEVACSEAAQRVECEGYQACGAC